MAGEEGVSPVDWGGGENTLILPYIRRLGPFLGVQILNFNIWGGIQKDNFWGWGYDESVDNGQGASQNWTFGGIISKHSRAFS